MACTQSEAAGRISSLCKSESVTVAGEGFCSWSKGAAGATLAAGVDVGSAKVGGDVQHWQTDDDEELDGEPGYSDILNLTFVRMGMG